MKIRQYVLVRHGYDRKTRTDMLPLPCPSLYMWEAGQKKICH